jgi:hypothetical protein
MYLFISSDDFDNQGKYPENTPFDFTIDLPHNIVLGDSFYCALCDFDFDYIVKRKRNGEVSPSALEESESIDHAHGERDGDVVVEETVEKPKLKDRKNDLYIYCDICESSYVKGRYLPLLRVFKRNKGKIYFPFYIKTLSKQFNKIRIYIRDGNMETPSFDCNNSRCTLHLLSIAK